MPPGEMMNARFLIALAVGLCLGTFPSRPSFGAGAHGGAQNSESVNSLPSHLTEDQAQRCEEQNEKLVSALIDIFHIRELRNRMDRQIGNFYTPDEMDTFKATLEAGDEAEQEYRNALEERYRDQSPSAVHRLMKANIVRNALQKAAEAILKESGFPASGGNNTSLMLERMKDWRPLVMESAFPGRTIDTLGLRGGQWKATLGDFDQPVPIPGNLIKMLEDRVPGYHGPAKGFLDRELPRYFILEMTRDFSKQKYYPAMGFIFLNQNYEKMPVNSPLPLSAFIKGFLLSQECVTVINSWDYFDPINFIK